MFQITGQLTNQRPPKSEVPELTVTSTHGIIKINAPAASLIGVADGDCLAAVPARVTNAQGEQEDGIYVCKGADKTETAAQFGAKLATSGDKLGGSLTMASSNTWGSLKGDAKKRKVYTVSPGESQDVNGVAITFYKLVFDREEEKSPRKAKALTA